MKFEFHGEIVVRTNDDGSITSIPPDPNNTDYAAYRDWVSEGNAATVLDVPEPVEPAPATLADVQSQLATLQAQVAEIAQADQVAQAKSVGP